MHTNSKDRALRRLFNRHSKSPRVLTQVDRIALIFGGARALRDALVKVGHPRTLFTIYRWNYPASRGGSDGVIPHNIWPGILAAAREQGILLTSEDLDPRPNMGEDALELLESAKAKQGDT